MSDTDGFLPLTGVSESLDVRDIVVSECCSICGRIVSCRSWACLGCRKAHGLGQSLRSWPSWARFLKQAEQNRRRDLGRDRPNIESTFDFVSFDESEGDFLG